MTDFPRPPQDPQQPNDPPQPQPQQPQQQSGPPPSPYAPGASQSGPVQPGAYQQGPYPQVPPQQGPTQQGADQQGPYQQGPYQQGPYPPGPGQPPYPPGQVPPGAYGAPDQQIPPPPARKRRRPIAVVGSILLAIVIAVGVRLAFSAVNSTANAQVGDCLHYTQGDTRLKKADCGSADANQKLFGIATDIKGCADVAGAEYAVEVGEDKIFCFGDKNSDPAMAINAVKVGDCLTVSGDDATKAPSCGTGTLPVLAVKKDVVKTGGSDDFATACSDVSGAENAYAWSLASDRSAVGTYDRVYCLGAQQ